MAHLLDPSTKKRFRALVKSIDGQVCIVSIDHKATLQVFKSNHKMQAAWVVFKNALDLEIKFLGYAA